MFLDFVGDKRGNCSFKFNMGIKYFEKKYDHPKFEAGLGYIVIARLTPLTKQTPERWNPCTY